LVALDLPRPVPGMLTLFALSGTVSFSLRVPTTPHHHSLG
jgi:hypothetical protein